VKLKSIVSWYVSAEILCDELTDAPAAFAKLTHELDRLQSGLVGLCAEKV